MALTGPAIINAGLGWDLGCRHVREKGRAGQGREKGRGEGQGPLRVAGCAARACDSDSWEVCGMGKRY